MRNNTVGATEITPVETEVTRSKKQESRECSRGRFIGGYSMEAQPLRAKIDELVKTVHEEGNDPAFDIHGAEVLCNAMPDWPVWRLADLVDLQYEARIKDYDKQIEEGL